MKEFFIQHTEKLVLGLCVGLAGWFIYSSIFGMPRYDKSPDTFLDAISRAQKSVMNSTPKLDDLPPLDFEADLQKLTAPVETDKYPLATNFIRPLELNYQFRGTPRVLQPQTPTVKINRGLILVQEGRDAKEKGDKRVFGKLLGDGYPAELIWYLGNEKMPELLGILKKEKQAGNNPGNTPPKTPEKGRKPVRPDAAANKRRSARGAMWAEVVAPFPHANQIREFISVLKEGRNKAGVRYALAEVERRELTEGRQWSSWKRVAWEKQFELFDSAEKLDNPFETLPPLVVVPGLAMRVPECARDGGGTGQPIRTANPNIPKEFEGARPVEWTAAEENPKAPDDPNINREPVREEDEDPDQDRPIDPAPRANPANVSTTFSSYSDVETAMIRVFDFTVEPNKRYQYRVRAVLFNPNFDRPDVVDPSEALNTFLSGEFSEPSEEIYVEPSTSLFVAESKTAATGRVDFEIYHWFAESGRWVRQTVPYFVGQIIGNGSLKPVKVPVFDPKTGKITPEEKPIDQGFDTNQLLLEVSQDQVRDNLPELGEFNVRPPREVVLVNEYGDLIRRRELDDQGNEDRRARDEAIRSAFDDKGGRGNRDREPKRDAETNPDQDE
jgi:hypothetical protein